MRIRIMLFTVLIAVVGLVLFALSSSSIYNEYGTQESLRVLEVYARMYEEGSDTSEAAAKALSEKLGVRVTFISAEGKVLSDSEISSLAGQDHSDRPEFIEAQKNGSGYDHNYILKKPDGKLCARVYSPTSRILLDCRTTEPGLQFYTGNFLSTANIRGSTPSELSYIAAHVERL